MAENGKISEGQAQKRTSPGKAYIRDKQTVEGGFQRSAHSIPLGELPLDRIRFTLLHPLRLLLVVFRGFLHAPQFLLQYRQLSLLPALNLLDTSWILVGPFQDSIAKPVSKGILNGIVRKEGCS